jgi:hypothetical protein
LSEKNSTEQHYKKYEKYATEHFENVYCDKLSQLMDDKGIATLHFFDELEEDGYRKEIKSNGIKIKQSTFERIRSGENSTKRETVAFIAKVLTNILREKNKQNKDNVIQPNDICTTYSMNLETYLLSFFTHAKSIKSNPKYKEYMDSIKRSFESMSLSQACKLAAFFDICYCTDRALHELIRDYLSLNLAGRKEMLKHTRKRTVSIEEFIDRHLDATISDYFLLLESGKADVEVFTLMVASKAELWEIIEEKIEEKLYSHPLALSYIKKFSECMDSFSKAVFSYDLGDNDLPNSELTSNVWELAIAYRLVKTPTSLTKKMKELCVNPEYWFSADE